MSQRNSTIESAWPAKLRILVATQAILTVVAIGMVVFIWINFSALQATVTELRREEAEFGVKTSLMKMAINDNATLVEQLRQTSSSLCGLHGLVRDHSIPEHTRTELLNVVCSSHVIGEDAWSNTLVFFKSYNAALTQRLLANGEKDFREDAHLYAKALRLSEVRDSVGGYAIAVQWRLRALEGLAYATMRAGSDTAAEPLADKANALSATDKDFPIYVFARATKLKLMCRRHALAKDVQQEYTATANGLQAIADRYAKGSEYRLYAEEDLQTFVNDGELRAFCSYVDLPAAR